MYHSLDSSGSVMSVTPQVFEAQMAWLAEREYRVMSLRQALAEREEAGDWPDKSVVLTFDDGYANVHEHALPVLLRYGFSATVFVITEHLDGINNWGTPLRRLGRQTMLSWNQVKDLADHGVEIGVHTLSHADLSNLGPEALEREIVGSVQEINSRLSGPVQTFAYPYGSVSDDAVAIVGRTFRAACITVHRRASDEPVTLLPRVEMYYFRNRRDLQPLISGQLDRALALRRWARSVRRFLPRLAQDRAVLTNQ
jgi:peptidoglycan/xylan/chitin deacetylase (PgdA/CDA1 family)